MKEGRDQIRKKLKLLTVRTIMKNKYKKAKK